MTLGDNQLHLLQRCKSKAEGNETHPSQLPCGCKAIHQIRDLAHGLLQLLNICSPAEPVCHEVRSMPGRENMMEKREL